MAMRIMGVVSRMSLALLTAAALTAISATAASADAAADQRIRQRVQNRLEGQVSLNIESLAIRVDNGTVTISGSVASVGEIARVNRIVVGVSDVRSVNNELTVRRTARSQADIEQEVRKTLDRRRRFRESIVARASGGVLTLSGQVERAIDKVDAEAIAGSVAGVTGVVNNIEILIGPDSPEDILERVVSILRNPLTFGVIRELSVGIQDGIVTLRGGAVSAEDRLEAERLTLTVPGVGAVKNQIVVLDS